MQNSHKQNKTLVSCFWFYQACIVECSNRNSYKCLSRIYRIQGHLLSSKLKLLIVLLESQWAVNITVYNVQGLGLKIRGNKNVTFCPFGIICINNDFVFYEWNRQVKQIDLISPHIRYEYHLVNIDQYTRVNLHIFMTLSCISTLSQPKAGPALLNIHPFAATNKYPSTPFTLHANSFQRVWRDSTTAIMSTTSLT